MLMDTNPVIITVVRGGKSGEICHGKFLQSYYRLFRTVHESKMEVFSESTVANRSALRDRSEVAELNYTVTGITCLL